MAFAASLQPRAKRPGWRRAAAARWIVGVQSLSVRVLGEFSVDGLEPAALGSRKARTVLRLLALGRGGFVPGPAIIAALWGQRPPSRPADQLSVLVSRLRAVLGRERLEHGDSGYRLRYDWLDADELTALSAEARRRLADGNARGAAAAASAALSLIRGEVGSDGVLGDWADAALADLERLVVRSRRDAASALAAAGNWLQASDLATAAVEHDPYDEDSLRLLMRANVAGGRVGAALAAYARARERLADDLGADPSPETEALHAAILRGEVAGPVPAQTVWSLVGRDGERDRLDAAATRAKDGRVQLVVVEGEAGIGKTSLLRAWAAARAAAGDAVLFGTCGTLDRSAPLDALITAFVDHLRMAGPERTAEVLGPDDQLLGRLLGLTAPAGSLDLLAEGVIGPSILFTALVGALQRIGQGAQVVLVLDDAHQAGPTLAEWLVFVLRRPVPLVIVAAVRSGEGALLPAGTTVDVGPLDRDAVRTLVGTSRLDELFGRSQGHPLLLSELAASDTVELPVSLVESLSNRCDDLGRASATLRSAAVIGGSRIDLDLLAGVLHRPVIELLDDVELGAARRLLIESDGAFAFRHDLIRAALAASATVGRAALLHREAARLLNNRIDADPIMVAHHAQLGGDLELASRSLRAAAVRAAERFDHATAEGLLDDAIRLHPDAEGWLDRARVRTRRGRYVEAYDDVARSNQPSASGCRRIASSSRPSAVAWSKRSAARTAAARSERDANSRSPPSWAWWATMIGSASIRLFRSRAASRCSSAARPTVALAASAARIKSWRNAKAPSDSISSRRVAPSSTSSSNSITGRCSTPASRSRSIRDPPITAALRRVADARPRSSHRFDTDSTRDTGSSTVSEAANSDSNSGWPCERPKSSSSRDVPTSVRTASRSNGPTSTVVPAGRRAPSPDRTAATMTSGTGRRSTKTSHSARVGPA